MKEILNFNQNKKTKENSRLEIGKLDAFDKEYFQELEGEDGWSALEQDNCHNQKYFTVYGTNSEKLGIIGVFDTEDTKNLIHIVVDPKFRGKGLDAKFKLRLMEEFNLPFITMTINLSNIASIKATEKLQGIKKVSDAEYEKNFGKTKYVFERPQKDN